MLFRATLKKKKKKKTSKDFRFIVEKIHIINIIVGEAVIISTFKACFETWKFFCKIYNKVRLKVGKFKKSEFQKLHVRQPRNHKNTAFS